MIDHLFGILRAHPELALFLALGIGYAVGKITIFGVTVGAVTGCLLAGVLIGQTGAVLSNDVKQAFFLLFLLPSATAPARNSSRVSTPMPCPRSPLR